MEERCFLLSIPTVYLRVISYARDTGTKEYLHTTKQGFWSRQSSSSLQILCLGYSAVGAGINHKTISFSPKCSSQLLLHTQYEVLFQYHFIMDPVDPIDDSRVSHCYANVNGTKYRMAPLCSARYYTCTDETSSDYLLGVPSSGYKRTVFLV